MSTGICSNGKPRLPNKGSPRLPFFFDLALQGRLPGLRPPMGQYAMPGIYTISAKVTDLRFTLGTTAGRGAAADGAVRFALKIWHTDPITRTEVVDYDNRQAGPGSTGAAVAGSIVHQM